MLSIGTPFKTTSGWFTPLNDDWPRMRIFTDPAGPVPKEEMLTPESLPCSVPIGFGVRFVATASAFTVAVAKPSFLDSFLMPRAVTTMSLIVRASVAIVTVSGAPAAALTRCSAYPTIEKTSVALAGTVILKLPPPSVTVPWPPSATVTFTPDNGALSEPTTLPVTDRVWADSRI